MMRAESDQHGFTAETLTNQLANIQFAVQAHFRRARIAEMRIVRPDDRFRLPAPIQMPHQRFDRLDHVPVSQIPGGRAPAKHRPIILLGVLH